ncbi:MAG: hypothetical protein A3F40_03085 [Chlamydiae bacterium RIFCSPHIGHO2_12_FULL_27_8]|nr:MAG: hypothetical protein A3F40_03085 [Chlamydiae bacterium RIFCSPHIGHO2_12_FULL_27_8]
MDYLQKNNFSKITVSAIKIAYSAGSILKDGFLKNHKIMKKEGNQNYATEYDLKSESFIIKNIKKNFKNHSILSEEQGFEKKDSEYEWVIDPLDGTQNFFHKIPMFSISIGVKKNLDILSGVVYNPILDEMFYAEKNKGSFLNGKIIYVSKIKRVIDSFLATGFPYDLVDNPQNCQKMISNVLKMGVPVRRIGSAAIDLAYVAAGRFDGFFEVNLKPWDILAGKLLVEEAKGSFSAINGRMTIIEEENMVLATNGKIHKELIKVINR